jgi:hypothetical protein
MGDFDKLFEQTFKYDLGYYDISLDDIINRYLQATGSKIRFISIKALMNSGDIAQHFIDTETLELHPAFKQVYPNYKVFKCGNIALVSFSDLLEINCRYVSDRNRYSLNEGLNEIEQVLLDSALGYLNIKKLDIYCESYSAKGSSKAIITEFGINHRGVVLIPWGQHTKETYERITVAVRDDNKVVVECCIVKFDYHRHETFRTGVRHTFELHDGVVTYKVEEVSVYPWMCRINGPIDLRKNPYNRDIWEYLPDEPAYQGTLLFVDSNYYHYGLINDTWIMLNFDQLPWAHSSIPPEVLAEYQLYTNVAEASRLADAE